MFWNCVNSALDFGQWPQIPSFEASARKRLIFIDCHQLIYLVTNTVERVRKKRALENEWALERNLLPRLLVHLGVHHVVLTSAVIVWASHSLHIV